MKCLPVRKSELVVVEFAGFAGSVVTFGVYVDFEVAVADSAAVVVLGFFLLILLLLVLLFRL